MAISFKKLTPFHFKKQSEKRSTATQKGSGGVITKLPNELLVCIYQHLETRDSLQEFSRTCRKFHQVSKDTRSKAAWMVTRFGTRFAIYYALLAVPERCNRSFLDMMIHMGARVPTHLIQSLLQVYGKPYPRRRRRSSFDDLIQLQEEFFSRQVQKLSFEGYLTLLLQHKESKIHTQEDDVTLFLSETNITSLENKIQTDNFFPAPLLTQQDSTMKKGCYRQLIKLAQTSPSSYASMAMLFEFDPVSRASLWESVLLVLFDEAFRSSELTQERKLLLQTTQRIMAGRVELTGPMMNDQTIFCQVFAQFFTKYPLGYCNQTTMDKLLSVLETYIQPSTFGIRHALEYMVLAQLGRSDTIASIDHFLKKNK